MKSDGVGKAAVETQPHRRMHHIGTFIRKHAEPLREGARNAVLITTLAGFLILPSISFKSYSQTPDSKPPAGKNQQKQLKTNLIEGVLNVEGHGSFDMGFVFEEMSGNAKVSEKDCKKICVYQEGVGPVAYYSNTVARSGFVKAYMRGDEIAFDYCPFENGILQAYAVARDGTLYELASDGGIYIFSQEGYGVKDYRNVIKIFAPLGEKADIVSPVFVEENGAVWLKSKDGDGGWKLKFLDEGKVEVYLGQERMGSFTGG